MAIQTKATKCTSLWSVDEILESEDLGPDMKMYILLTVLHTLLMKLVRRICPNIRTSYPW